MLLIIQSLPHPKNDLTNLMTSLTFLFYWQWCSERSCLLGLLSSSVLCALLNYLREKNYCVIYKVGVHVENALTTPH